MASTTLMPLDPALSPQRVNRILTISADLLPDEIVISRRARRSRSVVVVAVGLVVVLLGSWFFWAEHDVHSANDDLSQVTAQYTTLQKSQAKYQEVVDVQNETSTISRQLKTLMGEDLPWASLLDTLRVIVLGVSGSLSDKTSGSAAVGTLPHANGVSTIGAITITGTAPDKPSIAKYVDALNKLSQVANPYLTNATKGEKNWQFNIQTEISSSTRCGRFTTKCKAGGN
jgi:type IV pilus assembly protein PilN